MVLEGPCTRDTPRSGRQRGATGAFGGGGGVAATLLLHTLRAQILKKIKIA